MKKSIKKENEDWMQKKWRPMMAVMYMTVCAFDFIIFPIMFTVVQFWETQAANDAFRQWQPITLVGAGLFHMAMGAVLGITAWSRGQEKIAGVATSNITNNMPMLGSQPSLAGSVPQSTGFSNNMPYTQQSYANYESTYDTVSVKPVTGYKGKKSPVEPNYPEI
jgi:hypothetical protein